MRVLIIANGMNAVTYHRLITPWGKLNETGEIELSIFFTGIHGKPDEIESFKGLDVVIWSRNISDASIMRPVELINRIKKDGAVAICDIDDHWNVGKHHILNNYYRSANMSGCQIANLKNASAISCSTPLLRAEIIKTIGTVPIVLRNAIDPTHEQFDLKNNKHDYGSVSYIGGVTHERDLKVAYSGLKGVEAPLTLCGYEKSEIWDRMVDSGKEVGIKVKVQAKRDIMKYGTFYHNKGICLAPLEATKFNKFKSELKMLEGGHFSKVMVVSDYGPYHGLAKHMENCVVVKDGNWSRWINMLLKNQGLQDDLRGQLNIDVKKLNDLDVVNEQRFDFVRGVIEKNSLVGSRKRDRANKTRASRV